MYFHKVHSKHTSLMSSKVMVETASDCLASIMRAARLHSSVSGLHARISS